MDVQIVDGARRHRRNAKREAVRLRDVDDLVGRLCHARTDKGVILLVLRARHLAVDEGKPAWDHVAPSDDPTLEHGWFLALHSITLADFR